MSNPTGESKLNQLYREMLPAVGYYADDDAMISWGFPGVDDLNPVRIGNKRLVLPTLNHLKNPDWSQRIAFNPLKQNIAGGDSIVMDKFRDRATTYMNFTIGYLIASLAKLACSEEKHKDLSPSESRYLNPLMEADVGFVERIEAIIQSSTEAHRGNREFCKFTLTKGRMWEGAKRQRVAGAHFRIYEIMKEEGFNRVVAGVQLRIKDVKMLTALYEFIFPEITDIGRMEYGTDQMTAPSVIALMTVYKFVAERVNTVVHDLKDCIPAAGLMLIPVAEWADKLANINELTADIDALPVFDGNNTKNKVATEQENARIAQAAVDANVHIAQQTAQQHTAPMPAPTLGYAVPTAHPGSNSHSYQTPQQHQNQQSMQTPSMFSAPRPGAMLGSPPNSHSRTAAPVPGIPETHSNGLRIVALPSVTDDMEKRHREEQQAQALRLQQEAFERARNPAAFSQKLPENSCMINNTLYVPAPANTNGVIPAGGVMQNGTLYIPYVATQQGHMGVGMMPGNVGMGMMPPGMNQQMLMNSDPRTWPGVTPEIAVMLASNPAMKAQYAASMMQGQQQSAQLAQQASPHNQVPRYLQQVMEADRNAELAQRQAQFGAIFNAGGVLGGNVQGMVPGMGGFANGMTPQQMLLAQQQLALQQQMLQAGMNPGNIAGMPGSGMQSPGSGMQSPFSR